MTLYETLGIERDATAAEIKSAYRTASKRTHPDAGGTAEAFRAVQLAYDVLSDPQRRLHYDATGSYDQGVIDDEKSQIVGIISQSLDMVVEGFQEREIDPAKKDIVADILAVVMKLDASLKAQIDNRETRLKMLRETEKRFRRKKQDDGENALAGIARAQIINIEAQMAPFVEKQALVKKAIALVSEHGYDVLTEFTDYARVATAYARRYTGSTTT
jgi:curved DNA-binding protein CbpA